MLFPIYHHVQCSNGCCRHTYFVKTSDLVRAASRLACPVCHAVTQYAEVQAQQPGISQDAQAYLEGDRRGRGNDWCLYVRRKSHRLGQLLSPVRFISLPQVCAVYLAAQV